MAEEKSITWEEVAKHKTAESLWIVVDNKVYDVTGFMEEVSVYACVPCYEW